MGMSRRNSILDALQRACLGFSLLVLALSLPGCMTMGLRSAVDLTVEMSSDSPDAALVYVDEQYVGTLKAVAVRGLRLPEGKHRISVEKVGYFPYDKIVVSEIDPIHLKVQLLRLPD